MKIKKMLTTAMIISFLSSTTLVKAQEMALPVISAPSVL